MTALSWDDMLPAVAGGGEFRPGDLATRFVQPPFSVLDSRKGDWQERRRSWLSLGIRSELGRGALVIEGDGVARDRSAPGGSLLPAMSGEKDENGKFARGRTKAYAPPKGGLLGLAPAEAARERWAAEKPRAFGADLIRGPRDERMGASGRSSVGKTDEELREEYQEGGTSIFDPVLCELAYRWFAPPGGTILDPFAGGSVRGIVAAMLGHRYTGIDLSGPQLVENRKQAAAILSADQPTPTWLQGDSTGLEAMLPAGELYDMVWTCPPYFDLEVYSDDPQDLSAMEWPAFIDAYQRIIAAACERLRPGRFAGIVVSEVRDRAGIYRGLVPLTIHAFRLAGLRFYNDAVLVNSVGSLPLRVGKYMESSRKLGRAHQNVLVFLKGEPPRGWSYDRAAPPSPQLGLGLDPEPSPPAPPSAPAPEPEPVLSGGGEEIAAPGPSVAGDPLAVPADWDPESIDERELDAAEYAPWPDGDHPRQVVDHPDGYVADASTGEVISAPPEPEPERAAPPSGCPHAVGFHAGSLELSACRAGTWWEGWPSVIPPGPPGSGRTRSPGNTLWATSDDDGGNAP